MKTKNERIEQIKSLVDSYDRFPEDNKKFNEYLVNILLDYDYFLHDDILEIYYL
jgi:hypothetical protein